MTCTQCHDPRCRAVRRVSWMGLGEKSVGEVCRARVDLAIRMAIKEHQTLADSGGEFLDRLTAALLIEFF